MNTRQKCRRRILRMVLTLLLVLGDLGCASQQRVRTTSTATNAKDRSPAATYSTEQLVRAVKESEILGALIYQYDSAAWAATDDVNALKAKCKDSAYKDVPALGWIVLEEGDLTVVRFVGKKESTYIALYEVVFGLASDHAALQCQEQMGRPLNDLENRMFKARQSAIAAFIPKCSDRYNSVVIPGEKIGKVEWIVYLLAASTNPEEMVVGGHYKYLVSPDGEKIIHSEPLSSACLRIPAPRDADGFYATHILTPTPNEIHAFLSLQYKDKYLYVVTDPGVWRVRNGGIDYLGTREEVLK